MDPSALASSIVALRSSIKGLESRSSSLEWLLYVFVALVVIGVVLEFGSVVWEYREELEDFQRGTIRSPQKPSNRKLWFELSGAVLVAIGVSGELAIDVKSGDIQTALRAKNGELIGILQNASSIALHAASENEKQAAQLRTYAEGLKKQAEDERLARLKIEDAVAWRRLGKPQISELGSELAMFSRQLTAVVYNVSDLEAYSFASDIDVALHEFAHWNIGEPQPILKMREGPVNFGTNPPLERGVVIASTSDDGSRAAAKSLVKKLSALGFDSVLGKEFGAAKPTVQIMVEPRPVGAQGAAKLRVEREKVPKSHAK
jgi:hypothetical protein